MTNHLSNTKIYLFVFGVIAVAQYDTHLNNAQSDIRNFLSEKLYWTMAVIFYGEVTGNSN